MKRVFVPSKSGSDWQRLLGKPDLHWKKGYSAMSTASCWEEASPLLPGEIRELFDSTNDPALTGLELLAAIPEWEVPLPGGDRPSQTDVLALARNSTGLVVIGVEAKVDEPFGPLLGTERKSASPGKLERIRYLEAELEREVPFADSIHYQLLHRTVSALVTARAFHAQTAVMLVHSFSPTAKWRGNFDTFCAALNTRPVVEGLLEANLASRPRLLLGWCAGDARHLDVELPSAL